MPLNCHRGRHDGSAKSYFQKAHTDAHRNIVSFRLIRFFTNSVQTGSCRTMGRFPDIQAADTHKKEKQRNKDSIKSLRVGVTWWEVHYLMCSKRTDHSANAAPLHMTGCTTCTIIEHKPSMNQNTIIIYVILFFFKNGANRSGLGWLWSCVLSQSWLRNPINRSVFSKVRNSQSQSKQITVQTRKFYSFVSQMRTS